MSFVTFRLWWCSYRQKFMASECVCNHYDLLSGCGWVEQEAAGTDHATKETQ